MTSSRKVIDLLNKYGQCIRYNTVEELETEATFSSLNKSVICREDVELSSYYCTGVAFDNYDRFVETCSGKDTLHDTVGTICLPKCYMYTKMYKQLVQTLPNLIVTMLLVHHR